MNTIGERIKYVRKSNSLTQLEFSRKLGISRPHITNIENNKEKASSTVIRLISIIFDVKEDWLKNGQK